MRRVLLPALLLATGCFGPKKPTSAAGSTLGNAVRERTTAEGNLVVEVDLDGDDRPDIFNYYRQLDDGTRTLLRKEMDINHDGRIDVWTFLDPMGVTEREEMDGDFDGAVDWIDHYQAGRRAMSEIDTDNDGVYDLFKYYESGKIRRKERDTNHDGRIDHWEYFDDAGENVVKVGWDIDNDGQMDVREE